MVYLLFFLIPVVFLLAWGVMVDRKRPAWKPRS